MQRIYSKLLLLILFSTSIVAQEQIGVAAAVNRNTTDLTLEQERKLVEAGYQIIQNHTIETDEIGKAQMLLLDGTAFSVGPNSSVVLDRFIYNPETAEGSLEVTARGLLRIVGGKVTKKQPALIRTNSATVGIRGGIGIVQTDGSQVNATFLYGEEMTVTPNCVDLDTFGDQCGSDFITTITEPGFSVTVESADSEPSEPEPVTEESLEAVQDELEASEEEPAEEESSSEESSDESSSEESSSEESSDESSSEESSSEESSDDPSSDDSSSDESSSDDSGTSDSSSDDASSDASSDEPTTEVAQETESDTEVTTEVADAGGDGGATEVEVDEGLLDSSGVSDVSSDVAPDELGTADAFEVETEVDLVDVDESSTEEVTEEVAQTTQETTAEVAPIFEVETEKVVDSVDENTTEVSLASFALVNPGEQKYKVAIEGEGSEAFRYNADTNSLELIEAADHETLNQYELIVTFTSENGDVQEIALSLGVTDVDEAAELKIDPVNTISEIAIGVELVANQVNVSETVESGTVIATFSAKDPEGKPLTYSLSGDNSDLFKISDSGEVKLVGDLDYETISTITLTFEVSDGVNQSIEEIVINVINDDEAASIETLFKSESYAENLEIGSVIGTVDAKDPEGNTVTLSLSGEGSDNFKIDDDGNIVLAQSLDYETASSYKLTVVADDGKYASTEVFTITVANVNEAPSVETKVQFNTFLENTALGEVIAKSNAADPDKDKITFSLSGTGSELFKVDENGTVTLAGNLDFEAAKSYQLTLIADDGTNKASTAFTVNVGDVNEAPTISTKVAAASFAENISKGSTIATSSASDPESSSISYSLSGTGSENFSINADGVVTLAGDLDYETTTSYQLTIIASDGSTSSKETITINVSDVDEFALALSSTSPSINEGVSTGTQVATSTLTQQDSASVTYTLSGTGSDKFAISSSGVITTAAAMDYETTSSYSLTVTVTDGTNTDTETINITINDITINTLAVTLANSGTSLAESSSSGTSVGSSSISNPDSESVSYSLSGTGSSNFAVDSSGNITTNATLDFETAKSYALTLTATAGSTSVTDTFTVNVGNVVELNSAVLRYSASYNSASRSGFSATATRGPSGSSLPAYYLEQVGTTATSVIIDVDNISNNSVPVEIAGGSELNWRYFFPIDTTGAGQYAFAPNSASVDAKYKSLLGTNVTTTVSNSEVITAGRFSGGNFWFMASDKAGASISYDSKTGINGTNAYLYFNGSKAIESINVIEPIIDDDFTTYSIGGGVNYGYGSACAWDGVGCNNLLFSEDFSLLWFQYSGYAFSPANSTELQSITTALTNGATVVMQVGEHSGGCCGGAASWINATNLFAALGWSGYSSTHASGITSYNDNRHPTINPSSSYPNSWVPYSTMPTHISWAAAGYLDIPSVCTGLTANNSLFICDPTATGLAGTFIGYADFNVIHYFNNANGSLQNQTSTACPSASNSQPCDNTPMWDWIGEVAKAGGGTATTSTYNLFEDQVTVAGRVYTDTMHVNTYSSKFIIGMVVIPIENFATPGVDSDYFYPNFIPTNVWSYGDVGLDYCNSLLTYHSTVCSAGYTKNYEFASFALDHVINLTSCRFLTNQCGSVSGTRAFVPNEQSIWWQMFNPNGKGVGIWAQISIKDCYIQGACIATTRSDQESLLNVVISNVDYRKNDTSRYSAGDTGLGMDGYHYWSYQGITNATSDGLGITYGTSPIECATSNDSGCFWTDASEIPRGAMITSSDPYKSGNMSLSVNYNSNTDTFTTGSFNTAIIQQDIAIQGSVAAAVGPTYFRGTPSQFPAPFYESTASSYSGFFSGILEFDVSGSGNSQLAAMRSNSTLASFTFDTNDDDVQVVAPMTVSAAPANNYTANWTTVDTGSMTLKFGDATNDEAKSAYFSSEVFGAEIQDDGAQIDGTSGGSNNLAGVMVSYNTLEGGEADLFNTNNNDPMPDTAYSTWGFWAMSSLDISPNTGTQNASVHLGTWVGGETLAQNEIPTSGTASMSGAAVMKVAYRDNQTGTNYDVQKYTTTADVAASFTWGASGYSGTLNFSDFDNNNTIVSNAGFTAFTVAITGTDHTYSGNSTTSLQNDWLGGASVAGALYGDTSPDESGGRVNVNIYKSGDIGTAGANDFYMAEGIYLLD